MAVPAATNCALFESVLEKTALSGIFLPPKEEKEQRGNTHLCYFPALKYQTSSVTHTTQGECTQRRVCVTVCVTDLFITSDYSCLKIIQHASITPDSFCLSTEINFPLTLHCRSPSKLQIPCCQAAQLSIMWQPLASQTVIGWVLHTGSLLHLRYAVNI